MIGKKFVNKFLRYNICMAKIYIKSDEYSELVKSKDAQLFIENVHEIVNNNEEGSFEWGPFAIQIKSKQNLMESYKRIESIDTLLNEQTFNFI